MPNELRVIDRLGSGLMGVVFKAEDPALNRIIAVKVFNAEFDPDETAAYEHAKVMAGLPRHKNLVQIHSVGEKKLNGLIFQEALRTVIEMEWINGDSLAKMLRGPKFTENQVKRLCVGIISGIKHMHDHQVAHGDLHVGNVLVSADSEPIIIDAEVRKRGTIARTTSGDLATAMQSDIDYVSHACKRIVMHSKLATQIVELLHASIDTGSTLSDLHSLVARPFVTEVAMALDPSLGKFQAQTIQYLENNQLATLRDFAIENTRIACRAMSDGSAYPMALDFTKDTFGARVNDFEKVFGDIAALATTIGAWTRGNQTDRIVLDMIEEVLHFSTNPVTDGMYKQGWYDLRMYPSLVIFYSVSFACYFNFQLDLLHRLLSLKVLPYFKSILHALNLGLINTEVLWKDELKLSRYTPVSDRLVTLLQTTALSFAVNEDLTERKFDELQCFLSLVLISENLPDDGATTPVGQVTKESGIKGRYLWHQEVRGSVRYNILQQIEDDARKAGKEWLPLKAGFFNGSSSYALKCMSVAKEVHRRLRESYHMF